jgi:hypothetical protein
MGLTPEVAAAVEPAIALVFEVLSEHLAIAAIPPHGKERP